MSKRAETSGHGGGPLAIICGAGALPLRVAESVTARGRSVFLLGIHGVASPEIARFPHAWIRLGESRRPYRMAMEHGCREVCIIGHVMRPRLSAIRFDFATLRLVPRLVRLWRGGDDRLLTGIARIIEDEFGVKLVGVHAVAPEIVAPVGALGVRQPTAADFSDIEIGLALIRALGPHDVGQAVIVAHGRVLAVEAAEGTDAMVGRIAELRQQDRIGVPRGVGVLVKAPKPAQDRRLDLPAIGPHTVEGAARAGLAGIAVAAGATILIQIDAVVAAADQANLFVVGVANRG